MKEPEELPGVWPGVGDALSWVVLCALWAVGGVVQVCGDKCGGVFAVFGGSVAAVLLCLVFGPVGVSGGVPVGVVWVSL